MNEQRLRRFTRKWFSEWMPDNPTYGRASHLMHLVIEDRPTEAWQRILALVNDAPSDEALGNVAAGPLEDFLCEHAAAFIEQVEAEATRNERLAACLGGVWGWTVIDESLYSRIRKAARPSSFYTTDAKLEEMRQSVRARAEQNAVPPPPVRPST